MWKYKRYLFGILTGLLICICMVGVILLLLDNAEGGPSDGNVIGIPGSDLVVVPEGVTSDFATSTESTVPVPPVDKGDGKSTLVKPILTGLDTQTGNRGQLLSVSVVGTNFVEVNSVTFGAGIRIVDYSIASEILIRANLQIDWTATLGSRNVAVANGAGPSVLVGGFSVGCPVPTVESISLSRIKTGESSGLVITGSGFIDASDVDCGESLDVKSFSVSSPSTISVSIKVSKEAHLGSRDISVTTPGGTGLLRNALTVSRGSSNLNGFSSKILPGGLLVAGFLSILSWKKRTLLWCTLASSGWFVLAILCTVGKIIGFEIVSDKMSIVGSVSFLVVAVLVLLFQLRPKEPEVVASPVEVGKPRSYRQLKSEADEKRRELRKRMLH